MKRCAGLLDKTTGGPSPIKRIFSTGQTLARDGCQVSQAPGKECPVKSLEQNLRTVVSRKADPADSTEMPLARKRKQPEK